MDETYLRSIYGEHMDDAGHERVVSERSEATQARAMLRHLKALPPVPIFPPIRRDKSSLTIWNFAKTNRGKQPRQK